MRACSQRPHLLFCSLLVAILATRSFIVPVKEREKEHGWNVKKAEQEDDLLL
jgi:hypothetical protein